MDYETVDGTINSQLLLVGIRVRERRFTLATMIIPIIVRLMIFVIVLMKACGKMDADFLFECLIYSEEDLIFHFKMEKAGLDYLKPGFFISNRIPSN